MKLTLRTKFILLIVSLVVVIMTNVIYFFTIREQHSKRESVELQMNRIAQNIATMQLLDRQDWSVYQNYISQLMAFNKDIVYIAIYDARNALRAHTLNSGLVDTGQRLLTRRAQGNIVQQLVNGAVAAESRSDLRSVRVNIQLGDRILGSVHVGFSVIEINRELKRGLLLNVGLAVVFILIFSMVSIFLSGRLTRPLEKLSAAMEAVNSGDLNQHVQAETRDEIAQLTHAFNQMVQGMRERTIIDKLGYELSSEFQFDRLAAIVRERLRKAIGASSARLYIRNSEDSHSYDEITVPEEEKRNYPALNISAESNDYLIRYGEGFMIRSAPDYLLSDLQHSAEQEDGLVIPIRGKDKLLGLLFMALPANLETFSSKQRSFAATLSAQAAFALENAILYEELREQERIKHELQIARQVQHKLLPGRMPQIEGYTIEAICQSAYEVGGDYFDFFELKDNKLGVVIADVSGKGTSASFYMAEVKGMMLQLCEQTETPREALIGLNRKLFSNIERSAFVTMIYGILDPDSGTFVYARAGHNALIRLDKSGKPEVHEPGGIGLGLEKGTVFERELAEESIRLQSGEMVVLYTDGLTEAMNNANEEFCEEGLLNALVNCRRPEQDAVIDCILRQLESFLGSQRPHDDITMIVIRRHPESSTET